MRLMFSQLKIRHLLSLPSALCLMSLLSCGGTPTPPGGRVLNSMTAFDDGKFDASGVADVCGTDGVLFVEIHLSSQTRPSARRDLLRKAFNLDGD